MQTYDFELGHRTGMCSLRMLGNVRRANTLANTIHPFHSILPDDGECGTQ